MQKTTIVSLGKYFTGKEVAWEFSWREFTAVQWAGLWASTAVGRVPHHPWWGTEILYALQGEKKNLSEVETVIEYICQGGRLKEWEKTS